jgi:hypothetical protein
MDSLVVSRNNLTMSAAGCVAGFNRSASGRAGTAVD